MVAAQDIVKKGQNLLAVNSGYIVSGYIVSWAWYVLAILLNVLGKWILLGTSKRQLYVIRIIVIPLYLTAMSEKEGMQQG